MVRSGDGLIQLQDLLGQSLFVCHASARDAPRRRGGRDGPSRARQQACRGRQAARSVVRNGRSLTARPGSRERAGVAARMENKPCAKAQSRSTEF